MLSALHGDSDADVALSGGYYGTSEPKGFRQETPGYFPDSRVVALDRFGQTATVGSYPTHALSGSQEGGFCAGQKMAAYGCCLRISGYGVSWLPLLSIRCPTLR